MSMLPTAKTPPRPSLADLTVLWYGQTKIGKTSTCAQADGALFLATEPGLNALDVYQVPILNWEDLLNACAEISEGNHPFKTVIIDTIDNAYKFCTDYVLKKFKIEHESDLGYGKDYALINNEFQRVLTKLAFLPWPEWRARQSQANADATWDHIAHSPNCSIAKAERLLGYRPRYSSLEAVFEALPVLIERGIVVRD